MPGSFDTYFKPGDIHNPNSRPVGSRNKRTAEVLELIKSAGHQDPLLTLAELQANSPDEAIRAQAANMLAPYADPPPPLHAPASDHASPRDAGREPRPP